MKTETREYRDYELEAVHNPPFWQVSIYPTKPQLRLPGPEFPIVSLAEKEEAFAEARRRVDELRGR